MGLFIPFFSAGHPDLHSTVPILRLLDESGADYIEVGLPHSDALADGLVIQDSSFQALTNGMQIQLLCDQVRHAVSQWKIRARLILFSYMNPILTYGLQKTCREWKAAGGSCLLIPDLPLEESEPIRKACEETGLKLIFLIAPTSSPERIKYICSLSEEFIYLVSVVGVTGSRQEFAQNLVDRIQLIKRSGLRVVIGFGVGEAAQAQNMMELGADGVVVGSALVKLFAEKKFDQARQLAAQIRSVV